MASGFGVSMEVIGTSCVEGMVGTYLRRVSDIRDMPIFGAFSGHARDVFETCSNCVQEAFILQKCQTSSILEAIDYEVQLTANAVLLNPSGAGG